MIKGKTAHTVHSSDPLQSETSLSALRTSRITPARHLYIRNNQNLAGSETLEPADGEDWSVVITGLVYTPHTLSVAALRDLPQHEVEMVLQCSGNSRAKFSQAAPVAGAPWQHGAMGNVVFGGVRLTDVLAPCGVDAQADYLTVLGKSSTAAQGEPPFERSVPLREVLDSGLLALTLNGAPLPAVHGGPVRLVLPGFFGINNVKWLLSLTLADQPSDNPHQTQRYRLPLAAIPPGSTFTPTPQNSRSSYLQKLKSVLWSPMADEPTRAGEVELKGAAWTNGRCGLAVVEVSCDGGESWQEARLEPPQSRYAWTLWRLQVVLAPGEHELWVRAKDRAGEVQPLDGTAFWNPDGYEWNAVDKVRVRVMP